MCRLIVVHIGFLNANRKITLCGVPMNYVSQLGCFHAITLLERKLTNFDKIHTLILRLDNGHACCLFRENSKSTGFNCTENAVNFDIPSGFVRNSVR